MPEYRRVLVPGGTYFFTVVTYQRAKLLKNDNARDLLKDVWNDVSSRHPFEIIAYCILPDHFHLIIELPEGDANYSLRLREIKRQFSIRYSGERPKTKSESRKKRKETSIWQRRFWEHFIRDADDLNHHVEYIHYNPVKHDLVKSVNAWPSSSFHTYVEQKMYDKEWGESVSIDLDRSYGE